MLQFRKSLCIVGINVVVLNGEFVAKDIHPADTFLEKGPFLGIQQGLQHGFFGIGFTGKGFCLVNGKSVSGRRVAYNAGPAKLIKVAERIGIAFFLDIGFSAVYECLVYSKEGHHDIGVANTLRYIGIIEIFIVFAGAVIGAPS